MKFSYIQFIMKQVPVCQRVHSETYLSVTKWFRAKHSAELPHQHPNTVKLLSVPLLHRSQQTCGTSEAPLADIIVLHASNLMHTHKETIFLQILSLSVQLRWTRAALVFQKSCVKQIKCEYLINLFHIYSFKNSTKTIYLTFTTTA